MTETQPLTPKSEDLEQLLASLKDLDQDNQSTCVQNAGPAAFSCAERAGAAKMESDAAHYSTTVGPPLGSSYRYNSDGDKNLNWSRVTLCSQDQAAAISAPTVPTSQAYTGHYGFEITFDKQLKETKSVNWIYSSLLNKLYVRKDTACPIHFKSSRSTPSGAVIRATPVYLKADHVQEPVKRCSNHSNSRESNAGHPAVTHLVRCQHKQCKYHEDPVTGRHSLLFPYEAPEAGSEWTTELFRFMCFSSCVGGLNRRPIQLIFTLEHAGCVLGHHSVEVRICACPGRDKNGEEKAAHPNEHAIYKRLATPNIHSKRQQMGDDRPTYTLTVKGRENFEMLCRIRDCLELAALVPQFWIDHYGNQQMTGQKLVPNTLQRATSRCHTVQCVTGIHETVQHGPLDSFPDAASMTMPIKRSAEGQETVAYTNSEYQHTGSCYQYPARK